MTYMCIAYAHNRLASLAQKICTLWFQFFDAFFASKGYFFQNIVELS